MHTSTFLSALAGASLALANPAPAHPEVTPAPAAPPVRRGVAARQDAVGTIAGVPYYGNGNFGDDDDDDGDSDHDDEDWSDGWNFWGDRSECWSKYISIADAEPSETGKLEDWLDYTATRFGWGIITATNNADAYSEGCRWIESSKTISPPASLTSAYSAWRSDWTSWRNSVLPAVSSFATSCGGQAGAMLEIMVATDVDDCVSAASKLVNAINGVTTTAATPASTGGASGAQETGNGGDSDSSPESSSSTGGAAGPRETGFVAAAAVAAVAAVGAMAAL